MSLRPRLIPQCSACLRQYAFGLHSDGGIRPVLPVAQQQVRGKKKMPNNSATVTVRLLKDVPEFGRKGALVPATRGRMRNRWLPLHIAEYVTAPELRELTLNGAIVERDYLFRAKPKVSVSSVDEMGLVEPEALPTLSILRAKEPEIEKVTPKRSLELLEIFVPKRLDFYRETIIDESKTSTIKSGGIEADIFAAAPIRELAGRPIYGSVSTQDVVSTVRALMAENDESARVIIDTEDVRFLHVDGKANEADKLKMTGDFVVELSIKGSSDTTTRTVRVSGPTE